jgi:hypothetical protein
VNRRDYGQLRGRQISVFIDGWRVLRVINVKAGSRKGLRRLRAVAPTYEGRKPDGSNRWGWHGRKYTIDATNRSTPIAGVIHRGKTIPIDEFVDRLAKRSRKEAQP